MNDDEKYLIDMKNCVVCKYSSEWVEVPEDASCYEECIPHFYCGYHKCVVDDIQTCEYFSDDYDSN